MLNFKPTFSLSSITFIKKLFSSSLLSAIRVLSSAYLRLLRFLSAILIPACASSSPAFCPMYSAYKLDYKESWALKNWHFWTVVLEKMLKSPLDCKDLQLTNQSIPKEISPEYSLERLMLKLKLQYFGHLMQRTDSLEKTDAGKDWKQEDKGTTEDEMIGWHHWLNGHV